jgi:site-specific recombinase XerD
VRLYYNGKCFRYQGFPTKTKAREFYEKAKTEQKEGRFFPERYAQHASPLATDWIDQYVKKLMFSEKAPKTQYEERRYAKWWKARLAGKRLTHITPSVVIEAKEALMCKGYSAETIKHYLKFLRHVLNVAIRDDKLEKNPFAKVDLPKVPTGRTRFLTVVEENLLLAALGLPYSRWARLAILTGMRKSELFSLRWANVDLEQGFLTLLHTKSGKVQHVLLNEEAKSILRGFSSWEFSPWVFPSKTFKSHLDSYNFYRRVFLPTVKKTGLIDVTWHTLRHTFASRLAMNGHSDSTLAALLRHSGTALVQRYAHLSPSHLKQAVEGVSGFGKIGEKNGDGQLVSGGTSNETVTKTVTKPMTEETQRV